MRMSYQRAVEWIALNDNAGNGDNEQEVSEYISTALVADLTGKDQNDVARDVMRLRAKTTE